MLTSQRIGEAKGPAVQASAVAGSTNAKGALGVVLTSRALARAGAGLALALGPICCGLLLFSAEPDEK